MSKKEQIKKELDEIEAKIDDLVNDSEKLINLL